MKKSRKILVTSALFYANGPLHLGHLVETIQADIWVRFQKLCGHQCYYVSGDDAHGTPIMLRAEKENIAPEKLIADMLEQHKADLADFLIDFDQYYTTHSPENRALVETIYERLKTRGDIISRTIQQAYDPVKNMFLPDRFVKGTCPRCGTAEQYGDNCEACGATYSPSDLKNPTSVVSGAPPIPKESEHFFFQLQHYTDLLKNWMKDHSLQPQVINKLEEWFTEGLQDWDISRDAPYFGFEIPDAPGKYFYVWLDAPVGYMASFKQFCKINPHIDFNEFWKQDSSTELYHFIGKDIVYFHALFWPAMLNGAGFRTPTAVFTHGFLTVEGKKMSKSRGTFINARTYLKHLNPEYLRYYFAAKLSNNLDDIDLNFEDFTQRVNADLVGKVINIASRCAPFISRYFDGMLSTEYSDRMFNAFKQAGDTIKKLYETRDFNRAMREIMELADKANQYIHDKEPWVIAKEGKNLTQVQKICTTGLNLFRLLILYLKPVIPRTAEQAEAFLQISPLTWNDSQEPLLNHSISVFKPLLTRIEKEQIDAMKNEIEALEIPVSTRTPIAPTIGIEDFAKIDLRVARILKAEHVPEAEKLLKLLVDIGDGETRQIFAGIKAAYAPEDLEGKLTIIVANLAPRKMRFGVSEGMVALAVGPNGEGMWILEPQSGAKPGMKVQ